MPQNGFLLLKGIGKRENCAENSIQAVCDFPSERDLLPGQRTVAYTLW